VIELGRCAHSRNLSGVVNDLPIPPSPSVAAVRAYPLSSLKRCLVLMVRSTISYIGLSGVDVQGLSTDVGGIRGACLAGQV
jgi:hypothetical protein